MDSTPMPAGLRTVLIAVAAVLALVGATGIATGAANNSDDDVTATGSSTTTSLFSTDSTLGVTDTTALGAAGGTSTTVSGAPGTVKPGTKPATTPITVASTASNACTAPDGPGAVANSEAPAVGLYSYVNCADGSPGTEDKVEPGAGNDGKTRRRVTASRSGFSITEIRSYNGGNVVLEGLEIVSPFGSFTCDIQPDVVEIPAGLAKGKQWNGSGSCDAGPPVGKITFTGTGKVTGAKTVTIGTTTVQAWVIESNITVVAAGQTQKTSGLNYYDPSRGLDLYRRATMKDQDGNDQTMQVRLATLTPRPA